MFENKAIMNLALLLIFFAVAVGSVTVVKTTIQNGVFLTTSSPKGSYTVRLTGRKDRPKVPLVSHRVLFSVSKEGKLFLTNKYMHSGDWFDPSFDILYTQHNWVREDVLQFYREEFFNEGERESIMVQNKTKKVIPYLKVMSVDLFLLFDVQPSSTSTLIVSAPRGDNRWIAVDGEFLEGREIKHNGVAFLLAKGKRGPFAYYIYINDDGLTIESPDLEKYKGAK